MSEKYGHDGWGGMDIEEGVTNLTPDEVKQFIREWRADDTCILCLEAQIPRGTHLCDDCLAKIVQTFNKRSQ